MARTAHSSLEVEWFAVSYRGVLSILLATVLLAVGGAATWYYVAIHAPKAGASSAISLAERKLAEASDLKGDSRLAELVQNAEISLRNANEAFRGGLYADSRVEAMRSEGWSMQAIRLAGGAEQDGQVVRFYAIEGDVRVKRSGEFSWEAASSKMELKVGDQIKTASSASAQLIYFDGTLTQIQPGSLLEIRELHEDPVTKVRRVSERLERGEIQASTQKRNVSGSYHEVRTPKAAAKAEEQAEFRVKFNEQEKTGSFEVFAGDLDVTGGGKRESLTAGEGVRSNAAGKLSNKHTLPAVPRLIAPRDQRVFIFERPEDESIALSWEKVPGAGSYHLMISDRPLFTEPLFDGTREGNSADLEGAPPGSYFWKVAALSASGLEGQFTKPYRFRLSSQKIRDRSDTDPPALEITEFVTIGSMVIVNGRTEPGASLWVDQDKIDVDDRGDFYTVIRLRKDGLNELQFVAQDTAGNESSLTREVTVDLY